MQKLENEVSLALGSIRIGFIRSELSGPRRRRQPDSSLLVRITWRSRRLHEKRFETRRRGFVERGDDGVHTAGYRKIQYRDIRIQLKSAKQLDDHFSLENSHNCDTIELNVLETMKAYQRQT